jgi:hypothetical protein
VGSNTEPGWRRLKSKSMLIDVADGSALAIQSLGLKANKQDVWLLVALWNGPCSWHIKTGAHT